MVKWHEKYSSQDLVIVNIYHGPTDALYGIKVDDIQSHLEQEKASFPVLYDSDGKTCEAYGVRGYPSTFLLGRNGKVIWEPRWFSESRSERVIEKALQAHTESEQGADCPFETHGQAKNSG